MKLFKKTVLIAALSFAILVGILSATAFAEPNYTAQLVIEATSDQGEFAKAGDSVKVSLYLQNAGWAQKETGTGWAAGLIQLSYDSTVLQYVDFAEETIVSNVFDDIVENNIVNETSGEILWMGMNSLLENEISFTDEKTKLAEIHFIVKDDLPTNLNGVLAFDYPKKIDFQFGDLDSSNPSVPDIKNTSISPVFYNHVKFDTTPPTVTLDGSNQTSFYYSPVAVEILETNGIGSVTLDDEELPFPYLVSKSGTLVVTDKQGNSTAIQIQIDDSAYLAAKSAIANLPETITFQAESSITNARKAVDAVTDQTAKKKLDIVRLETAESNLHALQKDKAALIQQIANTQFNITLQAEHSALIEAMDTKVKELSAKGASFTTAELENLTNAKTAMAKLKESSKKVHAAISALPTAEKILWSDKQTVELLRNEVNALKELQDTFTAEEEAKLTDAEKELQAITALKEATESAIQNVLGKDPTPALATHVNAVHEKLEQLNEKGVSAGDVLDYDKFVAVSETVSDMLHKIDAVTAQIHALPQGEEITFKDEAVIAAVSEALKELQNENLDVTVETAAKLTAAQQEIQKLKAARETLVKEIVSAELTIDLTKENVETIHALRTKVDTLYQKGAAFTPEELKNLTIAEAKLTDLQKHSQHIHQSIAALPSKDQVTWQNKQDLDFIKQQMTELSALGDVFTESELQKLTEVETALDAIQAAADQLQNELEKLPSQPDENSESLLIESGNKINALNNDGYPVDETTMGQDAMDNYNTFKDQLEKNEDSESIATPAPELQTSSSTQDHQNINPLLTVFISIASLMAIFGCAVFFVIKKKKE